MQTDLPIYSAQAALCRAWGPGSRIVLGAAPGAGKSTQVPQILLNAGLIPRGQKLVVLQPRRLATKLVALRVAEQIGEPVGNTVGYQIRFERAASVATRLLFVTAGVLVRMMLDDPQLRNVAGIVFDEFHERHLASDLSLAWAKSIQASHRKDLAILVMSATLHTEALIRYLQPSEHIQVQGRAFPVAVQYVAEKSDTPIWDIATNVWAKNVATSEHGDCLIFMPSVYSIERTLQAIRAHPQSRKWATHALHAQLSSELQRLALESQMQRKVIVSTNIAETSVTINGISWVIDSGLARIKRYDPRRDVSVLLVDKISQASADQRAGRAGRLGPGCAIRLWPQREHGYRGTHEVPEIARIDLSEMVLAVKAGGLNPESLDWLDAPSQSSLERAYRLLFDLGALTAHNNKLTAVGKKMAAFPVHPRYSRMLIAADNFGCVGTLCRIAALAQIGSPLQGQRLKAVKPLHLEWLHNDYGSDFFRELHVWDLWRQANDPVGFAQSQGLDVNTLRQAEQLTQDFEKIASAQGLSLEIRQNLPEHWAQCILIGFKDRLARRLDSGTLRCALIHNRHAELRRSSVLQKAPLFVASDLEELEARGQITVLLNRATAIDPAWLKQHFAQNFQESFQVVFNTQQRRVVEHFKLSFEDLIIEEHESQSAPTGIAASVLAKEVLEGRLVLKHWNDEVEHWIVRMNALAEVMPELGIAPLHSHEDRKLIIEQICSGSVSFKEIKDQPIWPALKAWLSAQQLAALDYYAPTTIELPNRKRAAPVRYEKARAILSATVQDLYDVQPSRLSIAQGRIPLVVEVLAPNRRPVQLTQDLKAFWESSYPQIKKDLKGRYPKHEWR